MAVYPLSRLAGTLPRPTLDRALMSGVSMAVAFQAAAITTALSAESRRRRPVAPRQVVAGGRRGHGRRHGGQGRRAPHPRAGTHRVGGGAPAHRPGRGAAGAVAELATLAPGATALVAAADAANSFLPESIRPTHPLLRSLNVIAAGAILGVAARHRRLVDHLSLPHPDGAPDIPPQFQRGASIPIALGRSAGVAAITVGALALETRGAELIADLVDRSDGEPSTLAVLVGHSVIAAAATAAGLSGFAFYSSRVEVQERLLEAAYAAVPERAGVTGGPDSAYDFADLGREGRRFVSQAYTADELIAVLATAAEDPVRAWVPLSEITGDPEVDALAVVAEIERLGGFAKGVLVLSAPTGDGYVSYVHTETVELLTAGDCTTVAVPYAAVPSALAMPKRAKASAAYAVYARAIAARARELNPTARLFTFGESLGSIVALDAFGPDLATELAALGFAGGLYCGVPRYSHTDRALRPTHPRTREQGGLQYATGRDQALTAAAGHLNLTHPTDPVAVADPSTIVRHPVDYWGRPHGVHVPLVSFLAHLFDVKNAMNLRPGDFTPSPGHDYRYDTAAAVARAYDLPFEHEDVIESALRERELAWSVRRLLGRRIGDARDSAVAKLRSWGVDPVTVSARFRIPESALPDWLAVPVEDDAADEIVDVRDDAPDVTAASAPVRRWTRVWPPARRRAAAS